MTIKFDLNTTFEDFEKLAEITKLDSRFSVWALSELLDRLIDCGTELTLSQLADYHYYYTEYTPEELDDYLYDYCIELTEEEREQFLESPVGFEDVLPDGHCILGNGGILINE